MGIGAHLETMMFFPMIRHRAQAKRTIEVLPACRLADDRRPCVTQELVDTGRAAQCTMAAC